MAGRLGRLLHPRSVAVIGGGWGVAVIEQCRKMGFQGEIWAVHPTRTEMHGLACYPSIEALPGPPDAAFIGINRHATVEAVRALAARGAGGAVCFASGFAEAADDRAAGAALQVELVAAAGEMPVLGPNCYGLINYLDGALLWPDQHGGKRVAQGVAILGQSSNVLINLTMQRRGLPLAYVIAAGNQAQVDLAEMARALVEDPRVTAIGLHIEGVSDVRGFEALARAARAAHKPVVALKVGRSEAAQQATLSHTASLAGGDAASRAFLARLGIPVLASLPEFLETLMLAHVHGSLPGRALASISCSGGEASLIADAAEGRRVSFAPLTAEARERLTAALSDRVALANPLDYHTFIWGDVPRMTETMAAMMSLSAQLCLVIYDLPRTDRCSDAAWACGVEAVTAAQAQTGGPVAMVASLPENLPEARADALLAAGIAPLHGFDEALADLHAAWSRPLAAPVLIGGAELGQAEAAPVVLDEAAAKGALAAHGLVVPMGRVAETPEAAGALAAEVGWPVALKGLGLAHKTEAGALRLGLTTPAAVVAAARDMPGPERWLVEAMVADAVAELIVGVVRDPVYGFTLTLGAGGVLAELLADTATLVIPACEADVRAALAGLRVATLLAGYRGRPAADGDAVVAAVMAVQRYAQAEDDRLLELDVNPLIATPRGAVAADALIRLRGD